VLVDNIGILVLVAVLDKEGEEGGEEEAEKPEPKLVLESDREPVPGIVFAAVAALVPELRGVPAPDTVFVVTKVFNVFEDWVLNAVEGV
jgi:hypothetical protein